MILWKPLVSTIIFASRAIKPIFSLYYRECSLWVLSIHLWVSSPCQQAKVSQLIRARGICSINRQACNCLIGPLSSLRFCCVQLILVLRGSLFFCVLYSLSSVWNSKGIKGKCVKNINIFYRWCSLGVLMEMLIH